MARAPAQASKAEVASSMWIENDFEGAQKRTEAAGKHRRTFAFNEADAIFAWLKGD